MSKTIIDEARYIQFTPKRSSVTFMVANKTTNEYLGKITKHGFISEAETIFESVCLNDICEFMKKRKLASQTNTVLIFAYADKQNPRTYVWNIFKGDTSIGRISWCGKWRCYSVCFVAHVILDYSICKTVADFLFSQTKTFYRKRRRTYW